MSKDFIVLPDIKFSKNIGLDIDKGECCYLPADTGWIEKKNMEEALNTSQLKVQSENKNEVKLTVWTYNSDKKNAHQCICFIPDLAYFISSYMLDDKTNDNKEFVFSAIEEWRRYADQISRLKHKFGIQTTILYVSSFGNHKAVLEAMKVVSPELHHFRPPPTLDERRKTLIAQLIDRTLSANTELAKVRRDLHALSEYSDVQLRGYQDLFDFAAQSEFIMSLKELFGNSPSVGDSEKELLLLQVTKLESELRKCRSKDASQKVKGVKLEIGQFSQESINLVSKIMHQTGSSQ